MGGTGKVALIVSGPQMYRQKLAVSSFIPLRRETLKSGNNTAGSSRGINPLPRLLGEGLVIAPSCALRSNVLLCQQLAANEAPGFQQTGPPLLIRYEATQDGPLAQP